MVPIFLMVIVGVVLLSLLMADATTPVLVHPRTILTANLAGLKGKAMMQRKFPKLDKISEELTQAFVGDIETYEDQAATVDTDIYGDFWIDLSTEFTNLVKQPKVYVRAAAGIPSGRDVHVYPRADIRALTGTIASGPLTRYEILVGGTSGALLKVFFGASYADGAARVINCLLLSGTPTAAGEIYTGDSSSATLTTAASGSATVSTGIAGRITNWIDSEIHGLQIEAGTTVEGTADEITVRPGWCYSVDGYRMQLLAAKTVKLTTAGDQAGDGAGGAYGGALAAGAYFAVYLVMSEKGIASVKVSKVITVAENSAPTLASTDIAYRLIAVLPNGVGPAVSDTYTENVGSAMRRVTWLNPTGDISATVGDPQIVALGSTGDFTSELPESDVRRRAVFSVGFDPAEGAMDIDNAVALGHAGSTAAFAVIRQVIEVAADQAQEMMVSAEVFTSANGKVAAVHITTADNAHIRIISYDTDMTIEPAIITGATLGYVAEGVAA